MAFEAGLALQRPDDCLGPLPQPVREVPGGLLVPAGRADQDQAQVRAGEELLEVFPRKALVRHNRGARPGPVRGLVFQHLLGILALAGRLGVCQAEPARGGCWCLTAFAVGRKADVRLI